MLATPMTRHPMLDSFVCSSSLQYLPVVADFLREQLQKARRELFGRTIHDRVEYQDRLRFTLAGGFEVVSYRVLHDPVQTCLTSVSVDGSSP